MINHTTEPYAHNGPGYRVENGIGRWTCKHCGTPCQRPHTKGTHPKWCSEKCREDAKPGTAKCETCGQPCARGRSRWCSRQCQPIKTPQQRQEERSRTRREAARKKLERAARGTASHRNTPYVSSQCPECAAWFIGLQTIQRFCSSKCSKRWSRRVERLKKYGKFSVPIKVRKAVYERDNYTCAICNRPCPETADPNDLLSPTLDHIECQAWSLIADNSIANLRTAHRICNSYRNDESQTGWESNLQAWWDSRNQREGWVGQ